KTVYEFFARLGFPRLPFRSRSVSSSSWQASNPRRRWARPGRSSPPRRSPRALGLLACNDDALTGLTISHRSLDRWKDPRRCDSERDLAYPRLAPAPLDGAAEVFGPRVARDEMAGKLEGEFRLLVHRPEIFLDGGAEDFRARARVE